MQPRGPKILYRLSWSNAKAFPSEGCIIYSTELFMLQKLEKLKKLEARIHLEQTEAEWKVMSV